MIVDKINQYLTKNEKTINEAIFYDIGKLASWTFRRQFANEEGRETKGKLYLSSIGKCPRQLAYAYHGFEKKGKEIDSRAKIVFWTGDLVEMTVTNLAKLAGVNLLATGLQQITVDFPVNGTVVKGHPDGLVLNGNLYLLEVKSMSGYGFEKFEKGEVEESYLAQVNCYLDALHLNEAIMVALNKESGVLAEKRIVKDMAVVERCKKNAEAVLHSTPENLPPAPKEYDRNDKGFYPWQCLYCAYWGHCRTNAEKVLVKNSYKLKEKEVKDEAAKKGF
ncbi:MAG: hypothetical protein ABFC84_16830 [Veillonellales bacterium]